MTVVVKVSGNYAGVRKALDFAPRFGITVGVQGSKAAELHQQQPEDNATPNTGSGVAQTIAEIASEHELGLGVPERSFVRAYCDANADKIANDLRAAARQILLGRLDPKKAAELIGMKHAAGMQKWIADGRVEPPLSEFTIAKKGSSTPLEDTGQLRSAITYAVERVLLG